MMSMSSLLIMMGLLANSPSLKSAQDCYDALDYVCAEQQLAIALRTQLDPESMLAARKLDVLIAFAWRDEKRIDAGAKRLFSLDRSLVLIEFPADLIARIESHRPAPPKSSSLVLSLDYRLQAPAPSSQDARLWMSGEGGRMELGYLARQTSLFTAYVEGLKHFSKLDFSHESLTLYEAGFTWRSAHKMGWISLSWGLGLGVSAQSLAVKDAYEPLLTSSNELRMGAAVSFLSGLCIHTIEPFLMCLNLDPKLLIRAESGQPQTSYLFPLGIGLRYEYRLTDDTGGP